MGKLFHNLWYLAVKEYLQIYIGQSVANLIKFTLATLPVAKRDMGTTTTSYSYSYIH